MVFVEREVCCKRMTKEELIVLLRTYRENKARLKLRKKEKKMLELRREGYKEIETSVTTSYEINSDIHSKNNISDKVARKIVENEEKKKKNEEELEEVNKIIKELEEKVEEAEIRLDSLYYKEREILTAYYVDNRTSEDISKNLYFKLFSRTCTPRYVRDIIKKATEKLLML